MEDHIGNPIGNQVFTFAIGANEFSTQNMRLQLYKDVHQKECDEAFLKIINSFLFIQ